MLTVFLPLNLTQMAVSGVIRHTSVLLWRTHFSLINKSIPCMIWYQCGWKHFTTLMWHANQSFRYGWPPLRLVAAEDLRRHLTASLVHHMCIQPLPTVWILLKDWPKILGLQILHRPKSGLNPGISLSLCQFNIKEVPTRKYPPSTREKSVHTSRTVKESAIWRWSAGAVVKMLHSFAWS